MPGVPPGQQDPQRQEQNRQQGLLSVQRRPPNMTPGGFSGPGGTDRLNQIYGIMAEGADRPAAVGQGYVQATQRQQVLDRENQPIEQFLKLYGNVNPYDWSAPSLQKFHNNYIQTGQLQFDMLEPKKALTSEENKAILQADEKMYNAGTAIGRMGSMVDRFDAAARSGDYKQGILGSVEEWISQNITGNVEDTEALKQEWRDLKNKEVIDKLPPGVASDKDIAIAREGWPGPNVSPAYLAAFLRGMQKYRVMDFAYQRHRSHYIGTEETVQGLSTDWLENRRAWISDAMANNDLQLYQPRNPDGSDMTNEQAAQFFYRREGIGQQPGLVPAGAPTAPQGPMGQPGAAPGGPPQPAGGAGLGQQGPTTGQTEADIMKKYGL